MGSDISCVTDGQRWEMYETHQPGPLSDEKLVMRLDLHRFGRHRGRAWMRLALWRPSCGDWEIKPAAVPVIASITHVGIVAPYLTAAYRCRQRWGKLTRLAHAMSEFSPPPGSKPQAIRLPSGEVRTADNWADLTVAAVRWLSRSKAT